MIVKGIFTRENINDYIIELGIIMAKLHYYVKNDGYDIELFLSKEDDRIIIYVGDFDKSNIYDKLNDGVIDKICNSLGCCFFFPINDENFKNAYINEGIKYIDENTINDIYSRLEDTWSLFL